MLRRSVERLAALVRLRGRRVRMPGNGSSSPRTGSRRPLSRTLPPSATRSPTATATVSRRVGAQVREQQVLSGPSAAEVRAFGPVVDSGVVFGRAEVRSGWRHRSLEVVVSLSRCSTFDLVNRVVVNELRPGCSCPSTRPRQPAGRGRRTACLRSVRSAGHARRCRIRACTPPGPAIVRVPVAPGPIGSPAVGAPVPWRPCGRASRRRAARP